MPQLYPSTNMEEIELSETSSRQGDGEKRSAERKRAPAVVVFTSTETLWTTFALIYIVSFLHYLVGGVVLRMDPYVMSQFSGHSILGVLTMVVCIVSGVLRLPMAKFIDEFGRAYGFLMAAGLSILGLIIQAAARSLFTTIVAQVIFGIGWNLLDYVLSIVLADMTSLKNRALAYGIYVTPIVFSTFAAPTIAEQVSSHFGWRVAFSVSAIIMSLFYPPLGVLLVYAQSTRGEADEASEDTKLAHKPRRCGRLRRLAVELDLPGLFLAMAGLCLLLLPLTHPPGAQDSWANSTIIVMIVLGICSLISFSVWEIDLAPTSCAPWALLRDRNVLGGCLVGFFSVASTASWGSYYISYLQVVHDKTTAIASLITKSHLFAYAFIAPFLGLIILSTGRYKGQAFVAGPILGVFTGLLLVYNGPEASINALAGFQIFIGCSISIFIACSQIAVMANIDHKDVALAVGFWGTFISIAVAIASGISGSIWARAVPRVVLDSLPADSRNLTQVITGSLENEETYPIGSPIRDAVVTAIRAAQQEMVIMGLCFVPVAFACIFMWRNINVSKCDSGESLRARAVIW